MNAKDLIETIRATGAPSDDEIMTLLEEAYILVFMFEQPEFYTLDEEPQNANPHN
jgi:hypothetical protein